MTIFQRFAKAFFDLAFARAKNTADDVEIKFHIAANLFADHGSINVTNHRFNLDRQDVRFSFAGLTSPPAMTPKLLQDIWDAALLQGYVPHYLSGFGKVEIVPVTIDTTAPDAEEELMVSARLQASSMKADFNVMPRNGIRGAVVRAIPSLKQTDPASN